MINFAHLTQNERFVLNTLAVSGIAMVSILATQPFSFAILYSGTIAGILTALIQLKNVSNDPVSGDKISLLMLV